jgi:2-hydroxychromene-2-carboxylate isomerase
MSDRGLLLALQRLHDDPGFSDRITQDPDGTLGIYDMDAQERATLSNAVRTGDESALLDMANRLGVDWRAVNIGGAGALDESEVSTEAAPKRGVHGANSMTGDGYDPNAVQPARIR